MIPHIPRPYSLATTVTATGAALRKSLLSVPYEDTSFERRGFWDGNLLVAHQLERVGHAFVDGYRLALADVVLSELGPELERGVRSMSGFRFEGAGMALAMRDLISPRLGSMWAAFQEGYARQHIYMHHVGAGWAMARIPLRRKTFFSSLDPLLRWLAIDGVGFHEGYFRWRVWFGNAHRPRWIRGYGRNAFDQGLGRSLWFTESGCVARIQDRIHSFDVDRHADLWSGVGLASAYAGPVDEAILGDLKRGSGDHISGVAQGAVFAAKARVRAGNLETHTDLACRLLAGMSAQEASELADRTLPLGLERDGALPSYESWRQRVRGAIKDRRSAA